MKMQIKTLTPIHIGNGNSYGPMESYIEGNALHRINFDTLFQNDVNLLKRYVKALDSKNISEIISILKNGKTRYSIKVKSGITFSQIEDSVMECIKDSAGDVPYIPGSSVKGFIRTALIAKYLKAHNWNFELSIMGQPKKYNLWDAMKNGIWEIGVRKLNTDRREDENRKSLGSRFENLIVFTGDIRSRYDKLLFRYDAKYDIFKYLLIGDFYPDSYEIWVDKSIIYTNGRRGAYTLLEVVEGEFIGDISLSPQIKKCIDEREYPLLSQKLKILGISKEDLLDIESAEKKMIAYIQIALKEYIQDIQKFEKERGRERLIEQRANMRLGFGTGMLYKTLWVYMAKHLPPQILNNMMRKNSRYGGNIATYPKSYHLLSDNKALGWVTIS